MPTTRPSAAPSHTDDPATTAVGVTCTLTPTQAIASRTAIVMTPTNNGLMCSRSEGPSTIRAILANRLPPLAASDKSSARRDRQRSISARASAYKCLSAQRGDDHVVAAMLALVRVCAATATIPGMEKKRRLDGRLNQVQHIVVAADVSKLMRDDEPHLTWSKTAEGAGGKQDHRRQPADGSRYVGESRSPSDAPCD